MQTYCSGKCDGSWSAWHGRGLGRFGHPGRWEGAGGGTRGVKGVCGIWVIGDGSVFF